MSFAHVLLQLFQLASGAIHRVGAVGRILFSTRFSGGILLGTMLIANLASCFANDVVRPLTKGKGSEPFFQIHYGRKWGYMDRGGRTVIPPQFDDEGDFFGGLARVQSDGKWGFVDHSGQLVVPLKFDDAGDFSEGFAPVRVGRKWGFINPKGDLVIGPQFQAAGRFSEGLARFESWTTIQCGSAYFNQDTAPLYAFRLHSGVPVATGLCYPPSIHYGFVDARGKVAIPATFAMAKDFCEGVAAVQGPEGKYGYIDKTGATAVRYQFDDAESFSEGLAAVEVGGRIETGRKIGGRWGFIGHDGNFVVGPLFQSAHSFAEGFAAVSPRGRRWGYVDKEGAFVIPLAFLEADDFSEGLAVVWGIDGEDDDEFYIDKTGKKALAPNFPVIASFSDGLAVVGKMGQLKYISRTGAVVAAYEIDPR